MGTQIKKFHDFQEFYIKTRKKDAVKFVKWT